MLLNYSLGFNTYVNLNSHFCTYQESQLRPILLKRELQSLAWIFSSKRLALKWAVISPRTGQVTGGGGSPVFHGMPPTEISVFAVPDFCFLFSGFLKCQEEKISVWPGEEEVPRREGNSLLTCLICLCPLPLLTYSVQL